MGGRRGGEGQDVRKRATKQDVLFSPVPPESHIKPLTISWRRNRCAWWTYWLWLIFIYRGLFFRW